MNQKYFVGSNVKKISEGVSLPAISKIILVVNEEHAFEAGNDAGYALEIYCPYGTQQMADDLLAQARGFVYTGYSAESVQLSPEAELGDGVTVGNTYGMLAFRKFSFTPKLTEDIEAPLEKEVEHEYSYEGTLTKEVKRKLTLGASYYGTSITRTRGLEIKHYDASGNPTTRVTLNSETLAFYNANGNKAFYYDSTSGEFKISSSIVVGLDEYEKKAELSTDISTYIDTAEGTAKIVSACAATYLSQTSAAEQYETITAANQIAQSVSDVQSEISLSASYGSGTIGSNVRALLQLVSNADTSSIEIKADKINFTGVTTFVRPGDNISTLTNNSNYQTSSGVTTIIGNTVNTGYVEALNIKVKAAQIDGPLTIGQLPDSVAEKNDIPTDVSELTNDSGYQTESGVVSIVDGRITADYVAGLSCEFISGKIGSWTISLDEIWNGTAGISAGEDYTKVSLVSSGTSPVRFYCGSIDRVSGKFVVLDDGSLYAEAAQITGDIIATSGTFYDGCSIGSTGGGFQLSSCSGLSGKPCIYYNSDQFSGSGGIGSASNNNIYIGVDGLSYHLEYGGIYESSELNYNTAIRPAIVFVSGNTRTNALNYYATAVRQDRIQFYWGGSDDLRDGTSSSQMTASIETMQSAYMQLNGNWHLDTGESVTSDRNKKHDIADLDDAYEILFDSLLPKTYKYNYGTSNRTHTGFIAQDVKDAIEAAGLSTQDFAGYIEATIINKETGEEELECSLRYGEFIALNTKEIQKLKARVTELEDIVTKLQEG